MNINPQPERSRVPAKQTVAGRIAVLASEFPSRTEAARTAGISTEQLRRYIAGAAPRLEPIARLCQAVGWSLDYIWTGHVRQASAMDPTQGLRIHDAAVHRGSLADTCAANDTNMFCASWLQKRGWQPEAMVCIIWRGDSLDDLIQDGQPVLIDTSERQVNTDGLYALWQDEWLTLKIIQADWQGNLFLRSRNRNYREVMITADNVPALDILGRVVMAGRYL